MSDKQIKIAKGKYTEVGRFHRQSESNAIKFYH